MRSGALYFDNNPDRALEDKVRGAAKQYKDAYGSDPDVCYVHPFLLLFEIRVDDQIDVLVTNSVLPNHFFIGIKDES